MVAPNESFRQQPEVLSSRRPEIAAEEVARELDRQLREAWAASHRAGTIRRDGFGDPPQRR